MTQITNKQLITEAKSVVRPTTIANNKLVADVGAALITDKGNIYRGVCINTNEGSGFCAERSAIAAMVTAGEYKIERIVAVWTDGTIIPPCGKCRELIWQIHEDNWDTEVILEGDKMYKLKELLPHHWHNKD